MATEPTESDRIFRASAAGEPPRPPGPHHIVDPADVSETPVLSPDAHEVSDAEAELLVTDAATAPPIWASSRLIAGAVALVLIGIILGVGAWLAGWLEDDGERLVAPSTIAVPAGEPGATPGSTVVVE